MPDRTRKTVATSFACFACSLLLIVSLAGCAGLQPRPAAVQAPPQAKARLAQAHRSLDAAKRQVAAFYAELDSVDAKIRKLRAGPGWSGFQRILMEYPALTDPGRKAEITPEMRSRLSEWSRQWRIPWETFMRDYFRLVNSCAILEMKKVAARQMLISVQAAYMAVVMMDAAAGDKKDADKIFSLVNSLDRPGARLDAIHLDRLGLYKSSDR